MSRLDDYRTALLVANPDVSGGVLFETLDDGGPGFVSFVVDHGLGPLWHTRTGRDEFHSSRVSTEAHYLAQEQALSVIDSVLGDAGIEYAVIKGVANRLALYENPSVRGCHDIDLLVRPEDRARAASALVEVGFTAMPDSDSISRELILSRDLVDIDLHWGLLREGRLRTDPTAAMIDRRRRFNNVWTLHADDAFFLLLVHPAFAKHLAGWTMGLHRVVDIDYCLQRQLFDWNTVSGQLEDNGVRTAAWATLRWVQLLTTPKAPSGLDSMMTDLCPGKLRRAWLDRWLCDDLPERTSTLRWARLLGFSLFLHDTPGDSVRALAGRYRAHRRSAEDLAVFRELLSE